MPRNYSSLWTNIPKKNTIKTTDNGESFPNPIIQYLIVALLFVILLILTLAVGFGTIFVLDLLFN